MRDAASRDPVESDSQVSAQFGRLRLGEVHVFLSDPERQSEEALQAAFALLDPDERDRAGKFHFPTHRRLFVVAHGLLRRTLGAYVGRDPACIVFRRTQSGRPELDTGMEADCFRFSLSHAQGLVGCAIALDADIGFDVEEIRRPAPLAIADRYFARQELNELLALPHSERDDYFCAIWTLKEAYLKARNLGLSGGLGTFTTRYAPGRSELVSCEREGPAASQWTLRSFRLPGHFAAIAMRHPSADVRSCVLPAPSFL